MKNSLIAMLFLAVFFGAVSCSEESDPAPIVKPQDKTLQQMVIGAWELNSIYDPEADDEVDIATVADFYGYKFFTSNEQPQVLIKSISENPESNFEASLKVNWTDKYDFSLEEPETGELWSDSQNVEVDGKELTFTQGRYVWTFKRVSLEYWDEK